MSEALCYTAGRRQRAERKKVMRKYMKMLGICLILLMITGCGGPSEEKLEEVRGVYAELINRHNEVIEIYAGMKDDSMNKELDSMAQQINDIGQQDIRHMSEEEIDTTIEELRANIRMYDDILTSMVQVSEAEPEKNIFCVSVTIKNNTGIEMGEIYLYKLLQGDRGSNLAEETGSLGEYDVLNILNLYMTEEETLWHLEALDMNGKVIESADIEFDGYENKAMTVRMEYSFDTAEGWVELE